MFKRLTGVIFIVFIGLSLQIDNKQKPEFETLDDEILWTEYLSEKNGYYVPHSSRWKNGKNEQNLRAIKDGKKYTSLQDNPLYNKNSKQGINDSES